MKQLILIRGIPGSGKTTLGKSIKERILQTHLNHAVGHFENDDYHTDSNGVYLFKPENVSMAYEACRNKTRELLTNNTKAVAIVSNTFIKHKGVEPYIQIAKETNAVLLILKAKDGTGTIHPIPCDVIEKMKASFEEW